jgi:hypothetical protein
MEEYIMKATKPPAIRVVPVSVAKAGTRPKRQAERGKTETPSSGTKQQIVNRLLEEGCLGLAARLNG